MGNPNKKVSIIGYNMSFELFYSRLNFVVDILFLHCNSTLYICFKVTPKVLQNYERVIYTSSQLYQNSEKCQYFTNFNRNYSIVIINA